MKKFGFKTTQGQEPVNIACQGGQVAAARVSISDGRPRLLEAVVETLAGNSADKLDAVSRTLRLKQADIRLLLDVGEYQFMQAELPQVEATELNNALKWQIKDLLKFPVEQSTLDVITTPSDTSAGTRRPSGYAVVAPNELILDRMLRVRTSRSHLNVIDIPEAAQRNIGSALEESGRATAVLSITENGGLYTVSRNGALYFTRNFDITLPALAVSAEARRALFDRLLLELQRSMDVLDRQFSFLSVSTVWLAPFDYCDELLSLLIESLDTPVKAVDLASLFQCGPDVLPVSANEQAVLFFALGLALHQNAPLGQKINLVNPDLIPKQPVFPLQSQAIALGVITLGLVLLILFARHQLQQLEHAAKASQARVKAAEQRLAALTGVISKQSANPQVAQKLQQRELEHAALLEVAALLRSGGTAGTSAGYSPHLTGLAQQTVPGVWLSGFAFNGDKVDLAGLTLKADLLPAYLAALKRIPSLQGQSFEVFEMNKQAPSSAVDGVEKPRATEFRLISTLPQTGGHRP